MAADLSEVRRVNALAVISDVARRRWTRELSAEEQQRALGHGPELELIIERPELRPLKGQRVLTVDLRVLRGQELLYDDRVNSPNPPLAIRDVDGVPVLNELEALRQHLYDAARAATGGFQRPRRERRPDGTFRGDTLAVRSNTTDGQLFSDGNASWSDTQSGSGTLTANTTDTTGEITCSNTSALATANYVFTVLYMDFDTSSIADAATIDGYTVTLYGTGSAELDTDAQTAQCRAKDWGGSLTTADWINFTTASNWTGLPLVADFDITNWNQTNNTANDLTSQGALSAINKTGNTSLVFGTDRMTGAALPTGATHENRIHTYLADQTGTTSDPLLTVTYTVPIAYTMTVTGALTPAGALSKKDAKALVGGLTPAGALISKTVKQLLGAITPTGAVITGTGAQQVVVSGSITPAGDTTNTVSKQIASALTPTGAFIKKAARRLASSITSAGALTPSRGKLLTGSITPTSALTRKAGKRLAGALTSAGALRKKAGKRLTGTLASAGAVRKKVGKHLASAIAPAGAVARAIRRGFAGSITPAGALTNLATIYGKLVHFLFGQSMGKVTDFTFSSVPTGTVDEFTFTQRL